MRRSRAPTQLKKKLDTTGDDAISNDLNKSTSSNYQNEPISSNLNNNLTTTNQSNLQQNQHQIFSVVYGQFKPGKKKKEWTDDGILERNGKSIKIYNLEGECIDNNQYTKDKPLKSDDTFLFGSKEYMLIDPIKKEDFNSKKCFTNFCSINQPNENDDSLNDEKFNTSNTSLKRKIETPFKCPVKILKTCNDNVAVVESNLNENINFSQLTANENRFQQLKSINNDQNELYQVFSIIYGPIKPGKKRKEYNNDAILVRKGSNLMLYKSDGDKIESEIFEKKNRPLKCGDEFVAFGKEIQINDLIKIEDFESGNCFSAGFTPLIETKNQDNDKVPMEFKSGFKSVITNQTNQTNNIPRINNDDFEFEQQILMLPKLPDELCLFHQVSKPIICDFKLSSFLREHQREGIIFMYKCIMGFYNNIEGCILADEMGLGKTLQCIVLIYTLLKDGPFDVPIFDRVCILTPSSLVKNWAKEFDKWLHDKRLYCYPVDGKKHTVKHYLKQSRTTFPVLIISYDTFYRNRKSLADLDFSLIVCDEGHCLKNEKVKLFETIEQMNCKKRILITGTPIQNNLKELYNLSNLVCPGILGSREDFNTEFVAPIEAAQRRIDEDLSEESVLDKTKIEENIHIKLFHKLNKFILRREHSMFNLLLKKIENVVICKLTPIQEEIYNLLLNDQIVKKILSEEKDDNIKYNRNSCVFSYISFLRKLSNHPYLVKSELIKKSYELKENSLINQLTDQIDLIFKKYPKGVLDKSGKFNVLAKILEIIKENVTDKVVIVSHFTQTLDLIETFCRFKNYSSLRLDGSTPAANRQRLVDEFNSEYSNTFIFLLSSKAGGLGLNLIGASHIILYDLDWNPAFDQQSMARIWRDGQKKTSNIYRLLSVGTIDEKIFQRQLIKQNLSSAIGASSNDVQFSTKDLKDIFTLNVNTLSTTHDSIDCNCLNMIENDQNENESNTDDEQSMDDNLNEYDESQDSPLDNQNDDKLYSQNVQPQIKIKKENRTFSNEELDLEIAQDESSNDSVNNQLKAQLNPNDNYSQDEHDEEDSRYQKENYTDNSSNYSDYNYEFKSIVLNSSNDQIIKRNFENDDEEIVDELDNINDLDQSNVGHKIGLPKSTKNLVKNKPLTEWQHFSSPFDNSDMSSILFQASKDITFVFKTETD